MDLQYVFSNKNNFIGKIVELSGIQDVADCYNGKTTIIDIKFLNKDKKIELSNHKNVKYLFITIDKRHYKVTINRKVIDEIDTEVNNIDNNLQIIKNKLNKPLKYCSSNIITDEDEKLTLDDLQYAYNSFEGSNSDRKQLEMKIRMAINFAENINSELESLEKDKMELLKKKHTILNENSIDNILTKNRVSGCTLTH